MRKGKEQVRETNDIEDTHEDYVKVPLHGSIPPSYGFILAEQITPFGASLKVVRLCPISPPRPIPNILLSIG